MQRDRLQEEQKPEVGRAVVPWGRLLNDELSPVIGRYGELVGNLLEEYGTTNVEAKRRVDEFKNIVEQLGTINGEYMIFQNAVSKANLPKTELESQTAVTKNPDKSEDTRLAARMRSKALSFISSKGGFGDERFRKIVQCAE
jgi:hypothetical protein